jgi:hypothetical protein
MSYAMAHDPSGLNCMQPEWRMTEAISVARASIRSGGGELGGASSVARTVVHGRLQRKG